MDKHIRQQAQDWVNNDQLSAVLREEIQELLDEENETELTDRFYKELEFGTGGIRGVVGAGTNRLNVFNIRKVTQGISNYIKALKIEKPSVVIGFDSRLSSVEFSKESARVLAGNGIKVHFFDRTHATPLVSFAVRQLKATAGIMITASHNPPEYNGYKVIWSDGCQVTEPHDQGIIAEVEKLIENPVISLCAWEESLQKQKVEMIPPKVDEDYYKVVSKLFLSKIDKKFDKGIVYTPLHGVGFEMVNELMIRRGFSSYRSVKSQQSPNGNFPGLAHTNPEDEGSMAEAIKISQDSDHLILANDPDADRLGVMIRQQDEWVKLNGNQIGQILLYYWLELLKTHNKLPDNGFVISTIVTSNLGEKIAKSFNVKWYETLTGFKYIGRLLNLRVKKGDKFIFAYEESHGYQLGDYIREKDGISAALMFAELTRDLSRQGKSVADFLDSIYQKYGYHLDGLVNKVILGRFGAKKILEIMDELRKNPFTEFGGSKVVEVKDYLNLKKIDKKNDKEIALPKALKANVFSFQLANGTKVTARPSGTEPKIKFYFNFVGSDMHELKKFTSICKEDFMNKIDAIAKD
ncbi:MAG: phospho-sugar mutase [SAR324 cluster bacterium]|nr:phospho-sugar mutase [SAR324 cluster bacterium]